MGHTVASQRMMVDRVIAELESFTRALRPDERLIFSKVLSLSLKHVGAISYTSSLHVWAFVLLSIVVEQQKRIEGLEHVVNGRIQAWQQDSAVDQDKG